MASNVPGRRPYVSASKWLCRHLKCCQSFPLPPVGRYLRRSVKSSPHFISRSLVGQSLLFLADYAEIAQSALTIDGSIVEVAFQDRGFLSKLVYQSIVLQENLSEQRARKLLSAIMEELPKPDVTILLDAPMSVIESRLQRTKPMWLTPERRLFIERAGVAFRREIDILDGATFVLSQGPLDTIDDVVHMALSKLEQVLAKRG
jgi:thymidylate kinase